MFGIQEHLIREVSGLKERSLGEEMDPVRSWVRNVGVVDANVAAQRYSTHTAVPLTLSQYFSATLVDFYSNVIIIFHDEALCVHRCVILEGAVFLLETTCCKRWRGLGLYYYY